MAPSASLDPVQGKPKIDNTGWSTTAASYSKVLEPPITKGCIEMVKIVADLRPITDSSRVIDVGAGTGSIERALRNYCSDAAFPILAVDRAPGMADQLRAQKISNVTVEIGDATALSNTFAPDSTFTHGFGSLMIQFCGQRQPLVCQELFRVLEPGGIGALSIGHSITVSEPWNRACQQLDPSFEPYESYDETCWKTVDPLVAAMEEAGFVDVASFDVPVVLECTHEEWVSFWMDGKHPMYSRQVTAWKCDLGVLGFKIGIVVGRKPIW